MNSPGSKPIVQNGLPNLRSPKKAPRPSRPNLSRRPDETLAFTEQFHAPRSGMIALPNHRWAMNSRERIGLYRHEP